jgi:hypothetical protein
MFKTNLFLSTMWPKLLMWMCHVSFNYLLTPKFVSMPRVINYELNPHFMNVPHVNIVSVPCVTKPLAKCSIYIVVT